MLEEASVLTFGVWFLIGTAMVFFMQCGFAMLEAGFTRAKNAGNIIMKNLMDFCIGSVVFVLLGFSIMMAEDYFMGIIGIPNLDVFTDYANFPWSSFIFNLVFCATAATIVSGAMSERTKFSSYIVYSAVISLVIYPIEAGWVWNANGWLFQLGFIDFAGSSAIHMVGGVSALIGAAILGPRIGKYTKAKDGKITVNAIPGHNLAIGALGVFILWFGWYGFNGAAATSVDQLGSIFVTTTLAPAFATVVTMAYTWIRDGKPDVSMSLNGSLAGLVAITAPCANVDALGSIIIGVVAGVLVVVAVDFIDQKLHIDDPVGAAAVHGANGIWGTLAVGLFATEGGLFYGGGFELLGVQAIGVLAILAWVGVTMTITFLLIKKFFGIRVTAEEEIAGLDISEHGLPSAYPDFISGISQFGSVEIAAPAAPAVDLDISVPVVNKCVPSDDTAESKADKFTRIDIFCNPSKFDTVKNALESIGITGMTVTNVMGCGAQRGGNGYYRGVPVAMTLLPKVELSVVVSKIPPETVVNTARSALYSGKIGDGKIFVSDVENVIRVRTGECGYEALQDEDK